MDFFSSLEDKAVQNTHGSIRETLFLFTKYCPQIRGQRTSYNSGKGGINLSIIIRLGWIRFWDFCGGCALPEFPCIPCQPGLKSYIFKGDVRQQMISDQMLLF
jgi:hypothetical protein